MHRREEAHQRTGPLGEHEAKQPLVARQFRATSHQVAQVLLGQFVVGQIERREAMPHERARDLPDLVATGDRQADEHVGDPVVGDAVVELRDAAIAEQAAQPPESAALLGDRHREQRLALLPDLGALGNESQPVEVHVGAAGDRDVRLALRAVPLRVLLERRHAQRACRLEDAARVLEHVLDRGADRVGVDDLEVVDQFARQPERLFADELDGRAV